MNIHFKHYSGAMTQYDYLFFDCMAEVELGEEDEALQKGWLPDDYVIKKDSNGNILKSYWYQARQTRINLNKFKETRSTRKSRKKCKNIKTKVFNAKEFDIEIAEVIWSKYSTYRNFKYWELKPLLLSEVDRKYFLVFYIDESPIAYTFFRDLGSNSSFSIQFAWDYENPKLYLGKYANLAEIDHYINLGKDYMYLGIGYEKTCIYKSSYEGFEFWTGDSWSDDIDHYKWLCERDSKIEKLSDLEKIKDYDDEHFFK